MALTPNGHMQEVFMHQIMVLKEIDGPKEAAKALIVAAQYASIWDELVEAVAEGIKEIAEDV